MINLKEMPLDLKAIRARLDAATPGPWKHENKGQDHRVITPTGRQWNIGDAIYHAEDRDAEFIAHAPTDIAALIEALEKCKEALWPFANIHEKCWDTQDLITGQGSSQKAQQTLKEVFVED